MGKLLDEQKFWELYWGFERGDADSKALGLGHKKSDPGIVERSLNKSRFGRRMMEYARSNYHDYLLWNCIYDKYMPKVKDIRILEVGSAPGSHLVRLNKTYGSIPYGVECSPRGVELNREIFRYHDIDPGNVIHSDFFSDDFQGKYSNFFDVVISRGFIEDFSDRDASGTIDKHLNLLKSGGRLFVSIPNIQGIYYVWVYLFDRKLLSEMNTGIMRKKKFAGLFERDDLTALFCGYYGTFSCGDRFSTKRGTAMRVLLGCFDNFQRLLNIIFRVTLKDKGIETSIFSPYLQFVGTKK